jgi:hypothetical protein
MVVFRSRNVDENPGNERQLQWVMATVTAVSEQGIISTDSMGACAGKCDDSNNDAIYVIEIADFKRFQRLNCQIEQPMPAKPG